MEVALLLAQEGLSNEEMGNRLFISERTIKFHITNIFQKFGVKGRAEFMVKAKG
jgi:DNA-binding CsgD family transcriptional regulator